MKQVDTRLRILKLIESKGRGVTEIASRLKLSNQIIHRHIKTLLGDSFIIKKGQPPHTTYSLNPDYRYTRVLDDFEYAREKLLPHFIKKYARLKICQANIDKHDLDFMLKSSAVYSSNIEGVSIDLNSFVGLKDKLSKGAQKEISEVQDLVDAYNFAKSNKLTHRNFLKTHKLLSGHILSTARCGKYRSEGVGVFGQEGLVYSAVEDFLVPNEMEGLFDVVDKLLKAKMSVTESIFWSAWLHLEIALIHPFLDGNGRAARLLEKWFLAEKNDNSIWFLQTELYYFKNRGKYYKSLRKRANYWELNYIDFRDFVDLLFSHIKDLK
jgi:Fic family protein/predicted transcriptional regulator